MVKGSASAAKLPEFKSCLFHLLVWASDLTSVLQFTHL